MNQESDNEGAHHRVNVEPQPLLIDEGIAGAEFLAVFDEYGAAYRARYRHAVSGEQQGEDDFTRRGDLRDPAIGAGGHQVGENEVTFSAIAKDRQTIRNDSINR